MADPRDVSFRAQVRSLVWLQWKLGLSAFRTRRRGDLLRVVGSVVGIGLTLPIYLLASLGIVAVAWLAPLAATREIVIAMDCLVWCLWIVGPALQGSMTGGFSLSQLFGFPIPFRTLVFGRTLSSLLGVGGVLTLPFVLSHLAAWARYPAALPVAVVATAALLGTLILTGEVVSDLLEFIAGDRRLTALVMLLASLIFALPGVLNPVLQLNTDWDQALGGLETPWQVVEHLNLSRVLRWLPGGWPGEAMAQAAAGRWGAALGFLGLALALVALLFAAHTWLLNRLYRGVRVHLGAERKRRSRVELPLPGPDAFWALVGNAWRNLRRSPVTSRSWLVPLLTTLALILPARRIEGAGSLMLGLFVPALVLFSLGVMSDVNFFGVIDREGLVLLNLAPVPRRWLFLARNLASLLTALLWIGAAMAVGALVLGDPRLLPLGVGGGAAIHLSTLAAGNLLAVQFPYRALLDKRQGETVQNPLVFLIWGLAAAPPAVPLALGLLLGRGSLPGIGLGVAGALAVGAAIYALLLPLAARAYERRAGEVLNAVVEQI